MVPYRLWRGIAHAQARPAGKPDQAMAGVGAKDPRSRYKKIRAKATAKLSFTKRIPSYTAPALYRKLLEGKDAGEPPPKALAKATALRIKNGEAESEDLAPLVYLHIRLHGLGRPHYDHIVIDEAQDYSPFQLEALRLCQASRR